MQFSQFILLSETEQDVILEQALAAAEIREADCKKVLYLLFDFYTEKVYKPDGELCALHVFEHEQLLKPYLEQINISELIL